MKVQLEDKEIMVFGAYFKVARYYFDFAWYGCLSAYKNILNGKENREIGSNS